MITHPSGFRQWIKEKRAEKFESEVAKPQPSKCLTSLLVPRFWTFIGKPDLGGQKGRDVKNGSFPKILDVS